MNAINRQQRRAAMYAPRTRLGSQMNMHVNRRSENRKRDKAAKIARRA